MRIAFFHELPKGGARIAVSEIAHRLSKNHIVDLYYSDNVSNKQEESIYNNSYFFKFVPKAWRGKNPKVRIYKDTIELFKIDRLHKRIAKQINSKDYDLVFVNASKYVEAPFILKHLKKLKVFYLHDPHFRVVYENIIIPKFKDSIRNNYEKLHRRILKQLDKQNILKADYLIANSKYTKKATYKSYGIDSEVGYLGVDTKFFKPASIIEKDIDVLYIGSRDLLDGYKTLDEVMTLLKPDIKVRTLFKEEEWLTSEKVRELYRRSKIVLCFAQNEPFGLIAIEAASCGSVVIAIDEAGYKETVIDGKTGYLVSRNPKKIAEMINYLLSHPKTVERIGKNAHVHAEKQWSWQKRIIELEELLQEIKKL